MRMKVATHGLILIIPERQIAISKQRTWGIKIYNSKEGARTRQKKKETDTRPGFDGHVYRCKPCLLDSCIIQKQCTALPTGKIPFNLVLWT